MPPRANPTPFTHPPSLLYGIVLWGWWGCIAGVLWALGSHKPRYLTKPVEPERLKETLGRVKERIASQSALLTQKHLKSILAALTAGTRKKKEFARRLIVPKGAIDSFVNVDDIEWIEAADYYASLHVGTRSFMRETIKQLAETLDPRKFVRVHRSAIVNIAQVREILSEGGVLLASGHRLKTSKAGWDALLATFDFRLRARRPPTAR